MPVPYKANVTVDLVKVIGDLVLVTYNAICPECDRRWTDRDFPLNGTADVKRCPTCPRLLPRHTAAV